MRVLVVDDYATMRRIVRAQLQAIGYGEVAEAESGGAALAYLEREECGLVIADWRMEPVSGFDLVQRLRADPRHRALPCLMVLPSSMPGGPLAAETAGADGFLLKPFDAAALKAAIARALDDATRH